MLLMAIVNIPRALSVHVFWFCIWFCVISKVFFFSDFICFVGDIIKQLESVWVWMCLKYILTK